MKNGKRSMRIYAAMTLALAYQIDGKLADALYCLGTAFKEIEEAWAMAELDFVQEALPLLQTIADAFRATDTGTDFETRLLARQLHRRAQAILGQLTGAPAA